MYSKNRKERIQQHFNQPLNDCDCILKIKIVFLSLFVFMKKFCIKKDYIL